MKKILHPLAPLAPLVLVVLIWQGVAEFALWQRGVPFPTPWQTVLRLLEMVSGSTMAGQTLGVHLMDSLRRWLIGFIIAATLGIAFGLLAGRFRTMEIATARIPQTLLLVPGLAWVPVAILLFGVGENATIFMIALAAFAPVAVTVLSGIRAVDNSVIRAARMLGANSGTLFFRVLVPAALPSILVGLRLGLGTGWRVLVAAEMVVGTGTGLGYSIIQSRWNLDYTSSFACIVVVCALGLAIEQILMQFVENRTLQHWSSPRDAQ